MSDNDHLVLISGKSSTGKSASLINIKDPEGVLYLNCENKKLPFKSKFREFIITDPYQIYEAFDFAKDKDDVHTIIIDSLTYMMSMFQTMYVENASNGLKAWGDYSSFFRRLMSQYVATSTKNVVFTAHTVDQMNESEMVQETLVKVQGNLMTVGIESFFSVVIGAKKIPIKTLNEYDNELLTLSEEEKALGFRYVYQTKLTKETVNDRIRSPLGMWDKSETFINNDIQSVFDRLHEYYS